MMQNGRHKKEDDDDDELVASQYIAAETGYGHPRNKSPSSGRQSRQHLHLHHPNAQQSHRRLSASFCLRCVFFVAVSLWISLQLAMTRIYTGSLNISREEAAAAVHNSHEPAKSFYGDAVTSLVDQVRRGYTVLLATLIPWPSNNDASSPTVGTTAHQQIEEDYVFIFYLLLGVNLVLMLPSWCKHLLSPRKKWQGGLALNSPSENVTHAERHSKLLQVYLPAYLLATAADWLQGPYKYALYSSYGYTQRDIAHLFVAGYGSG